MTRPIATLGVLAACAAFLFVDPQTTPIVLWDESRLAVNALEMRLRGFSLVTTYGFAPDLWNTKPPLLVWLMQAAMGVFGASEWALRIPSGLAAMGTLAMVMGFTRRAARSTAAGALAAVLLALSPGFFGEHGARTGDYDALLSFFTTAYLLVLYRALHSRRPEAWRLVLAGGLIAGAVLTKSIAGLVPGVGLAAYLLIFNRWRRPLSSPWAAAAAALAIAPVAAFYLLREAQAPGYLAAVWTNDVAGRFMTALDQHAGPPWYYLDTSFRMGLFSGGLMTLTAPLALLAVRGRARQGLIFALCAAAGVLAAISLSSTKLPQYALPAYPFLAIAAAIAAHGLWTLRPQGRLGRRGRLAARAALGIALAGVAVQAWEFRYRYFPGRQFYPQALYGRLFSALAAQGVGEAVVVERGAPGAGLPTGYAPQLRFYGLLWETRGLKARQTLAVPSPASGPPGGVVASCDPRVIPALRAIGRAIPLDGPCVALRLAGPSRPLSGVEHQ